CLERKSETAHPEITHTSMELLKFFCSSSRENITPARGALKAAASPAPAPQVSMYRSLVGVVPVRSAAPSAAMDRCWTEGPSRPRDRPPRIHKVPPMILEIRILSQF